MFRKKHRVETTDHSQPVLRCSFCNKDQNDVQKLIAGPEVFICNECVEVCNDILADDLQFPPAELKNAESARRAPDVPVGGPVVSCALCRMLILPKDGLPIYGRGLLCSGCVGEVEAAIAERRESGL